MTELQESMKELEAKQAEIVKKLRARLKEIEAERSEIIAHLTKLEGRSPANGTRTTTGPRRARSPIGRMVYQVVLEAGTDGLDSNETVEAVQAEDPTVERGAVLTHLSRQKKRGELVVQGEHGFYRYIAATLVEKGDEDAEEAPQEAASA